MTDEELLFHVRGGVYQALQERITWLKDVANTKTSDLENAPKGKLRTIKTGKKRENIQYYHRMSSSDSIGTYIKKGNTGLINALMQKVYDKKLLNLINDEIKSLTNFLSSIQLTNYDEVFTELSEDKKELVIPLLVNDETFLEWWLNTPYQRLGIRDGSSSYTTSAGELVRSKSELIIANTLKQYNVPYKYECPLMDNMSPWVYPDFTVLNVKKRKVYYWEHFGMMDDQAYSRNMLNKLEKYRKHGLFLGDQLIATFESSGRGLDIKEVEDVIEHYLL